jgi:hypothetical protein
MKAVFHRLRSPKLLNFLACLGASLVFGLLWYLLLYNRFPLYLSHVDWIYKAGGDALQHQLGWEWFRYEDWRFPFGSIQSYGYPVGSSIAFMDAIPLFAFPFKLLSPILGEKFQYLGIWELTSIIGQMLMGILILAEFTRSFPLKILGASLLVLSPPMIFRAFTHNALSAHWLILAAIWFLILEYRHTLWRGAWPLLFGLAVLTHAYFVPMLLPIWLAGLFFHYRRALESRAHKNRAHKRWQIALDALAVAAVIFLGGYLTGLFRLNYNSLALPGYGKFSWNLNAFFNPINSSSRYLKEMALGAIDQYEGYSYLGLGILLLLPPAVYLFFRNEFPARRLSFLLPVAAASAVLTVFALSNKAFIGAFPLWDFHLPDGLLGFLNIFRSSGRFIWPVFYFLVLFVLIVIIRNLRFSIPILALALLLQFSDLQPLYRQNRLDDFVSYQSQLQSPFWTLAAETNEHIVVVPTQALAAGYTPLAIYAANHQMTLNLGAAARSDSAALENQNEQVQQALRARQVDPQTLYILSNAEWSAFAETSLKVQATVCRIDGFTLMFSRDNPLTKTDFDFTDFCEQ